MSSIPYMTQQNAELVHSDAYVCVAKSADWVNATKYTQEIEWYKYIDKNVKVLFIIGVIPLVIALATGNWPVAFAGFFTWALAALDIFERKNR